jgi:hypothetical protein
MHKQRRSYTRFMREQRRPWFPPNLTRGELDARAKHFFDDPLYTLGVRDLEALVNGPAPEQAITRYLGSLEDWRGGPGAFA